MPEQRDALDLLAENERSREEILAVAQRYFTNLGKNTEARIKSRMSIVSDSGGMTEVRDIFSVENSSKDRMRVICRYHFKRDELGIMGGELGAYYVSQTEPIAIKWDKHR